VSSDIADILGSPLVSRLVAYLQPAVPPLLRMAQERGADVATAAINGLLFGPRDAALLELRRSATEAEWQACASQFATEGNAAVLADAASREELQKAVAQIISSAIGIIVGGLSRLVLP
jgi:hypothetical protein